jgi:hypothetical protein
VFPGDYEFAPAVGHVPASVFKRVRKAKKGAQPDPLRPFF